MLKIVKNLMKTQFETENFKSGTDTNLSKAEIGVQMKNEF